MSPLSYEGRNASSILQGCSPYKQTLIDSLEQGTVGTLPTRCAENARKLMETCLSTIRITIMGIFIEGMRGSSAEIVL